MHELTLSKLTRAMLRRGRRTDPSGCMRGRRARRTSAVSPTITASAAALRATAAGTGSRATTTTVRFFGAEITVGGGLRLSYPSGATNTGRVVPGQCLSGAQQHRQLAGRRRRVGSHRLHFLALSLLNTGGDHAGLTNPAQRRRDAQGTRLYFAVMRAYTRHDCALSAPNGPGGWRTAGRWPAVVRVVLIAAVVLVATVRGAVAAGREPAAHARAQVPAIRPCKQMLKRGDSQFLVWVCNSGSDPAGAASRVLKLAENYAPKMIGLMGAPWPDSGGIAAGGDRRIDIYVVNGLTQGVVRDGTRHRIAAGLVASAMPTDLRGVRASGYMLLNRQRLRDNALASDFVHEFFHVLQFRYNIGLCDGGKWWFDEASATWAETYWVPGLAKQEVYGPRYVHGFEIDPKLSLLDGRTRHDYDSFIWPYFMQQQAGAHAIADVWKSLGHGQVTRCRTMNNRLDRQLSFTTNFRDFAVRNLDEPQGRDRGAPEWPQSFGQPYEKLHANFPQTEPFLDSYLRFTTIGQSRTAKLDLPPLSTIYEEIHTVPSDVPVAGLEIDPSSLSGTAGLSVDVIGYESAQSGHNHWIRVRESRPDNGVCMAFDPGDTQSSHIYLVISNSSLTNTTRGPLQIKARGTCATSASGTITHTQQVVQAGGADTVTTDTTITMALKLVAQNSALVSYGSVFSYSVNGTDNDGSTTCNFGGSGSDFMGPSIGSDRFASLDAYATPRDNSPVLNDVASGDPLTGCSGGFTLTDLQRGCPIVPTDAFFFPPGYAGAYSADASAITFNCSDTTGSSDPEEQITETVTGTLTARGVIPCGLWTAGCVNGKPATQ